MKYGPKYALIGSRLSDDTLILRAILTGLNSQGREWQETIIILDDGSLQGLEHEVEGFRHLEHRRVRGWVRPNIIIAFMDRLSHNRGTHATLEAAYSQGTPCFLVSSYAGESLRNLPPQAL